MKIFRTVTFIQMILSITLSARAFFIHEHVIGAWLVFIAIMSAVQITSVIRVKHEKAEK